MSEAEILILQAKYVLFIMLAVAAGVYVVALWFATLDTSPRCKVCGERRGKYPNENTMHEWWPMVAGDPAAMKRTGIHMYEPEGE